MQQCPFRVLDILWQKGDKRNSDKWLLELLPGNQSTAGGVAAAVIFGYLMAVIFTPNKELLFEGYCSCPEGENNRCNRWRFGCPESS